MEKVLRRKTYFKSIYLFLLAAIFLSFLLSCNRKEVENVTAETTDAENTDNEKNVEAEKTVPMDLTTMSAEETIEAYFNAFTENEEDVLKVIFPDGDKYENIKVEDESQYNRDIYDLKIKHRPEFSEDRKPDEVYYITYEVNENNLLYHQLEETGLIYDCNQTTIGIQIERFFHMRLLDTDKHWIIKSIGTGP